MGHNESSPLDIYIYNTNAKNTLEPEWKYIHHFPSKYSHLVILLIGRV